MKLIGSRKKDYFDYLIHLYGEDPLVILDRRPVSKLLVNGYADYYPSIGVDPDWRITSNWYTSKECKYIDVIDDYLVLNGIAYPIVQVSGKYELVNDKNAFNVSSINSIWGNRIRKTKDYTPLNIMFKRHCLIIKGSSVQGTVPNLEELKFNKVMSPQEVYLQTVDFITQHLSKKDEVIVEQSNKEKIVSHGFDLKQSFRGK